MSAQAVNKGKHSENDLFALFGHDQGIYKYKTSVPYGVS